MSPTYYLTYTGIPIETAWNNSFADWIPAVNASTTSKNVIIAVCLSVMELCSPSAFAAGAKLQCEVQSNRFDARTLPLVPATFEVAFEVCTNSTTRNRLVSLRSFELAHEKYRLVTDPANLSTGIIRDECLQSCNLIKKPSDIGANYGRALDQATAAPYPLQNDGIRRSDLHRNQMFLSVDLCPSFKPLERDFFDRLINATRRMTPVALSVSGSWIRTHVEDFQHLLRLEDEGHLKITWVNHSYTHPYNHALPLIQNFELESGINFSSEVFENEKLLLEKGIVPSIFFRFPGLVSDQKHIDSLRSWGLIPLGAEAWLALGETAKNGSIILVHGNGNEPKGLRLFNEDIETKQNLLDSLSDIRNVFF